MLGLDRELVQRKTLETENIQKLTRLRELLNILSESTSSTNNGLILSGVAQWRFPDFAHFHWSFDTRHETLHPYDRDAQNLTTPGSRDLTATFENQIGLLTRKLT